MKIKFMDILFFEPLGTLIFIFAIISILISKTWGLCIALLLLIILSIRESLILRQIRK